jgi:hypothetical protein
MPGNFIGHFILVYYSKALNEFEKDIMLTLKYEIRNSYSFSSFF